jgi:general secretion pathway protein D
MKFRGGGIFTALLLALAIGGCQTAERSPQPLPSANVAPELDDQLQSEPTVRATIVRGQGRVPVPPQSVRFEPKSGNISLNFPSSDVRVVAKATLGDILHVGFTVTPDVTQPVSVVTPRPIAKSSLVPFLEEALRASGVALVAQNGGFTITPIASARASGAVGSAPIGYSTEVVRLQFVSADEMRKLLDSVIPGTVTSVDAASNSIVIAGTSGQRASARDLLRQFDVNWLRNMSFALLVPQRTDARLIVPELDKLINAPDSPTRGLVRLISMDQLNGILAISAQPQYLEDVRRWVEILDREGENAERRLFVYNVQNGRARDLARTLNAALGNGGGGYNPNALAVAPGFDDYRSQAPAATSSATVAAAAASAPASGSASVTEQTPKGAASATVTNPPVEAAEMISATITADETNNAIIVFGTPRQYAVIEDALRRLDVLPYQVLIEAAITEVTLTDNLRYGVQWNFQTGDSNFALTEGPTSAPTRIFPGFSYFYGGNNLVATLNALEKRTNVKVISAPKLLVLNNQTAALQVGNEVPVATQEQQSTISSNNNIINTIEYRDTGVILKLTPRVNHGGLVLLDIAQEVSDVTQNNTSDLNSPVFSTRRISTSIAVQDGQVIALGGLFKDSKSFGKNGLPILSRIPILGALFGTHTNIGERTELLVILKPSVLRTIDDGRAITEELRAKLKTLEPFKTEGRIP